MSGLKASQVIAAPQGAAHRAQCLFLVSPPAPVRSSPKGFSILYSVAPHFPPAPLLVFHRRHSLRPHTGLESTWKRPFLLFLAMSSRDWQVPVLERESLRGKWANVDSAMGVPCLPRLLPRDFSSPQWSDQRGTPEDPGCSPPPAAVWHGSPRLECFTQAASVPGHGDLARQRM